MESNMVSELSVLQLYRQSKIIVFFINTCFRSPSSSPTIQRQGQSRHRLRAPPCYLCSLPTTTAFILRPFTSGPCTRTGSLRIVSSSSFLAAAPHDPSPAAAGHHPLVLIGRPSSPPRDLLLAVCLLRPLPSVIVRQTCSSSIVESSSLQPLNSSSPTTCSRPHPRLFIPSCSPLRPLPPLAGLFLLIVGCSSTASSKSARARRARCLPSSYSLPLSLRSLALGLPRPHPRPASHLLHPRRVLGFGSANTRPSLLPAVICSPVVLLPAAILALCGHHRRRSRSSSRSGRPCEDAQIRGRFLSLTRTPTSFLFPALFLPSSSKRSRFHAPQDPASDRVQAGPNRSSFSAPLQPAPSDFPAGSANFSRLQPLLASSSRP